MVPALFEFISGRSLWWRHFHFGRSQDTSMIARSHFFYPSVCIGFRASLTGCGWDKSFCPCLWRTLRLQSPVNDRRHTQLSQYWHVNGKQGEQWGSRFVSRVLSHLASWVRGSTRADLAQHSSAQHSSARTSLSLLFVSGDIYKNASLVLLLLLLLCPGPK